MVRCLPRQTQARVTRGKGVGLMAAVMVTRKLARPLASCESLVVLPGRPEHRQRDIGRVAGRVRRHVARPRVRKAVRSRLHKLMKSCALPSSLQVLMRMKPSSPCRGPRRRCRTGRAMGERTRSLLSLRSTMETHVLATMEACGAAYYASLAMLGSSMMKRVGLTTLGPRSWSN